MQTRIKKMKQQSIEQSYTTKQNIMYWTSVFLMGFVYVFVYDTAYFDRTQSYKSIWTSACSHIISSNNQQMLCMARYDDLCLIILIFLLMLISYKLIPIYRKKVFFIPLLGVPIFFIIQFMLCSVFRIICL